MIPTTSQATIPQVASGLGVYNNSHTGADASSEATSLEAPDTSDPVSHPSPKVSSCAHPMAETIREQLSMDRIMGLAVFGEKVAARTYALMADLRPEDASLLRKFARMEGQHGTWFAKASEVNGFQPDRKFADKE